VPIEVFVPLLTVVLAADFVAPIIVGHCLGWYDLKAILQRVLRTP